MGGYVFFGEDGRRLWTLNLSGAIVWYGFLEEMFEKGLKEMTLEEHNFGHVFDAATYRQVAQECIQFLSSDKPLPTATDTYRRRSGENLYSFKKDVVSLFRDYLKNLPPKGMFFVVNDLETDWWDEPCGCQVCKTDNRWEEIREWYMQGFSTH